MERKHLTLSCGDQSITLLGAIGEQAETGLFFSSLDGWYSTPQTKVDSTEYETANGAPRVTDDEVHYAARTVTIGVSVRGSNRDAVRSGIESILGFAQKVITVTVSDAKSETYATGYVAYTSDTHMDSSGATGSLVIVCNDPQRYSTRQSVGTIVPTSVDGGGLVFDDTSNLTPFFSRSLTDTSYWKYIHTNYITQLTDGWAHVACDNSAGTKTAIVLFRPKPQSFMDSSFVGTALVEIRNASGTATIIPVWNGDANSAAQLQQTDSSTRSFLVADGTYYRACIASAYVSTAPSLTGGYISVNAGNSVEFDLRLSLYEGTYTGEYKPYYERVNVLHWPLSFGAGAIRTGNSCTIYNNGTIPADITITASGNMPDGFALTNLATGEQLVYGGMVTYQPVTLDVFDGTAFIAGVDVSRNIGSWDFSGVPAGGSCSFSLQASGTGTVQISCRDTYV